MNYKEKIMEYNPRMRANLETDRSQDRSQLSRYERGTTKDSGALSPISNFTSPRTVVEDPQMRHIKDKL